MFIYGLELFNFRSYEKLALTPDPNVNIFIGHNAQGKTNIIEALFLCSAGRSFRGAKDYEMIRWERDFTLIKLKTVKNDGKHSLDIGIIKDGKKSIKADGKPLKRMGELIGNIPCVIFSPEHLAMIKSGPAERRRFLDIALSQIKNDYFYFLQKYNRALRQRNILLKQKADTNQLVPFELQLAETGAKITRRRIMYIEALTPYIREIYKQISGGERIDLAYQFNPGQEDNKKYLDLLDKNRARDIKLGATQLGPHKDDIAIYINGHDARTFASQGQQRTAVLCIKLSELNYMKNDINEQPVLLLDDVMSELDEVRQQALVSCIKDIQAFITCTHLDDAHKKISNAKIYIVEAGKAVTMA